MEWRRQSDEVNGPSHADAPKSGFVSPISMMCAEERSEHVLIEEVRVRNSVVILPRFSSRFCAILAESRSIENQLGS